MRARTGIGTHWHFRRQGPSDLVFCLIAFLPCEKGRPSFIIVPCLVSSELDMHVHARTRRAGVGAQTKLTRKPGPVEYATCACLGQQINAVTQIRSETVVEERRKTNGRMLTVMGGCGWGCCGEHRKDQRATRAIRTTSGAFDVELGASWICTAVPSDDASWDG